MLDLQVLINLVPSLFHFSLSAVLLRAFGTLVHIWKGEQFLSPMERHNEAVATIAKIVKGFYERQEGFRIYHGSTNSTRRTTFDPKKVVDTSALSHVPEIDIAQRCAVVEPNVPMDKLVRLTLRKGLVPAVVPEFPGITVGGSFSGTAGESSSFKYGFFDRTVNWCDVVLADGEIVRASRDENAELFDGAAGAFGTLGVTTLFSVQLVPARKYVQLMYHPVTGNASALATIKKVLEDPCDYLDGILFTPSHGVVITGHLTDAAHHKLVRFTRAHDPWFYLYAQKASSSSPCTPFTVPIYDYLFRYDRGAFWMGKYSFQMSLTPFNRLTRFLLDPFMRTRKMYQMLHASGHAQRFIIQDLAIPAQNAERFLDYLEQDFAIYPLWLCPLQARSEASMHRFPPKTPFVLNVGVWGLPCLQAQRGDYGAFVDENRKLERKVKELGGWKWLYAQAFYTEDEFWEIYERGWYDALRKKYHAEGLPTIYDKVKSAGEFKAMSEWKGWLAAVLGRNTLLKK